MKVYIKRGVLGDLCPELHKELGKIIDYYRKIGRQRFYITSMRDGNHISSSLHYIGRAVDFEIQSVQLKDLSRVIDNNRFDLVNAGTHFHLEYDPKND